MKYGHFSKDGLEYIVTRTDTPRPWFNRFGNREYSVIISNAGGGFAVAGDSYQYFVNWYIPRMDRSGRYVYVRDDATGEYWSASYAPVCRKLDHFECRHGLGWTTFVSRHKGIECEHTVFVPVEGAVELWFVKVTNRSRRRRRISLFPFLEWSIDDKTQGISDIGYNGSTEGNYDPSSCATVGARRRASAKAFLMTDVPFDSWDANRAAFVGGGRSLADPVAVERGRCSNTIAYAELAVGALAKRVSLKPGASAKFALMSGMAATSRERRALRKRFLIQGAAEREYDKLKAFWNDMSQAVSIKTPDKAFDRYVNRCLVRHVLTLGATHAVRYMKKSFRNHVQDAIGLLHVDPAISRQIILKASEYVMRSGDTLGGWSLSSGSNSGAGHVTKMDPKLWLVAAACLYVQQTNDTEILETRVRFWDHPTKSTLLTKLNLILDKCWKKRGPHGLSLMGGGDWNDRLLASGGGGKAESVWTSLLLQWAMGLAEDLARRLGDTKRGDKFAKRCATMRKAINTHGWDGRWYLRCYTDQGKRVGSRRSEQAKLFLLPQAWAVIAGVATPKKKEALFHAIDSKLETEYGTLLFDKPFTKLDEGIGGITSSPGGFAENGAVYSHAASFKLCADGVAGRGNALYEGLLKLFPYTHDSSVTRAAPYVFSNFYRSDYLPSLHGATLKPWKTSTPNWVLRAVVEGLMGLRVQYDRLILDPAIPARWKHCSLRRVVQGDTYVFDIQNPEGVENGVKGVWLDGKRMAGNEAPLVGDGRTHRVRVLLGRKVKKL